MFSRTFLCGITYIYFNACPNRGIPNELMLQNNQTKPIDIQLLPTVEEAIELIV